MARVGEDTPGFFSPGGGGLFSFFGNEPTSYEALVHRRKIAEALAAQKKGFPKNVGEGLTYLGESIGEAGLNYRLRQAEAAQLKSDDATLAGAPVQTHTPTGAAPPPSSAVGPRASNETSGYVATADTPRETSGYVATADTPPAVDGTEAPATRLSYAPEAPRDLPPDTPPPPVADPTAVSRPPASILPMQDQRPPVPWTELAQGAKPGRPMEGVAMRTVPDPGNAQLRASPSPQAFFDNAPSMPMEPGWEGTPRLGGEPSSPTRVAQTEAPAEAPQVADVPLPRSRPAPQVASAGREPGVYDPSELNPIDQAAVNRSNPMVRGVNPRLVEAVNAGALSLPDGYRVRISSGQREGDSGFHGRHAAVDVKIIDPNGDEILSKGPDKTGLYTQLARGAYTHALKNDEHIAWGGAFDTSKQGGTGNRDLMHFDTGPERGNLDPSLRLSRLGPLPANFDPNAPGGAGTQIAARTPREAVTNAVSIVQARDAPPSPTDAAQVARTQDVLGMGSQPRLAPTASLGRAGVASDAPPLGVNPVNADPEIARSIEQRNAIAKGLLDQEQKVPAPEVPATGPTQAGTEASPSSTTTDSNSAAISAASTASPRLAQAPSPTVSDAPPPKAVRTIPIGPGEFGVPPSGVLGPAGATPERAGTPTNIPAAPPPDDSAAYVKVPPFKSAIEPPGPEPQRTLVPLSDAQKYWAPFINNPRVSPTVSGHAKQVYEQEEKFRSLKQTQADNDYVNKRAQWDKDVDAWKNKDERDVKTLTGRMALEKAQFEAVHMAPFEARQKAAEAKLKEAELSRDSITLEKARADLLNVQLQTQQERFKLQTMNPLEQKSKELANQEAQQKVDAGQHTTFNGRILKNVDGAWVDVSPMLNPDNIQLNESQTKGLRFYENSMTAKGQMTKLDQLTSLKEQTQANLKYIGNFVTSDEYRSMRGAMNSWLINTVRDDTGAVIGPNEVDMYRDIYFPAPGDGPRQIQEKADRRTGAERAMYDGLGTAKPIADKYRKEIEAMDATGVPDGKVRTDTKTGEQQESYMGRWRPRKAKP